MKRTAAPVAVAGRLLLGALAGYLILVFAIPANAATPKVVATGFLAVTTGSGSSQISSFHLDGSGQKQLTTGKANHYGPSVSPNGKQVLFTGEDGGASEVYRMNIDGTGVIPITRPPANAGTASWAPDGSAIAYVGFTAGKYQVFRAAPDGSSPVQLTHDAGASTGSPAFSPDGATIAYSSFVLDTKGGGSVPISRIWVMNARDGSGARALSAGTGDGYPGWIDNSALLFARTSNQGKASGVFSINLAGVEKPESPADSFITEPTPLPDGKSYGATLLSGTSFGLAIVSRGDGASLAASGEFQLLASTAAVIPFKVMKIPSPGGDEFTMNLVLVAQPAAAPPPAAAPGATPGSIPWVPILIAVVVLVGIGVGVFVLFKPKKDCSKEQAEVDKYQARLERDLADLASSTDHKEDLVRMIDQDRESLAWAQELLARCDGSFVPAAPPVPVGVAPPPPAVTPPPTPPTPPTPPSPPPPVPPVPPLPPTPPVPHTPPDPPPPPTKEKPKKPPPRDPCGDGAEPKTEVLCTCEVELWVLSKARIEISNAYQAGEEDIDKAIDGLENALSVANIGTGLIGAVTDPVGSLLGSIGVPGADDATSAATEAALKGLRDLGEKLKKLRKYGPMNVTCPRQRYRMSCVVTSECQGGYWVVTDRSLTMEKLGKGSPVTMSNPPLVVGPGDLARAFDQIERWAASHNGGEEQKMRVCEKACQ